MTDFQNHQGRVAGSGMLWSLPFGPRICYSPDTGEGTGEPAAAETPAAAEAPEPTSEDDIVKLLAFDPFPGGQEAEPAAKAAPDGGEPKAQEETPAPQAAEPGKETPKPGEEASEVALLKKTIEELKAAQVPAQPAATPAQPKEEPSGPTIPEYQYTIPDQLIAGLASEDPTERKSAIGALCQGVSQTVHQQVLSQVAEVFNATVPRMIFQTIESNRVSNDVKTDFYGTYPDLNNPQLYGFIQQQALLLMQETGQGQWSPQFRDALATRVKGLLNMAGKPAAVPQTPTPSPQPAMFGGGARPAPAGNQEDGDIMNTLFGGS